MVENWQFRHGEVIGSFLKDLNKKTDAFILKGGTSLKLCYGLDRFSEDIDLDVRKRQDLIGFVDDFCKRNGYSYRVGKDTETVKRCFINYGDDGRPLKVEASYRRSFIADSDFTVVNGLCVYKIDRIAQMKANAYSSRDKIRDLYDVVFICNNYFDDLSGPTKNLISDAIENKGLEQFDYLISTQKDPLIDNNKLASDFLNVNEKFGLLYGDEERNKMNDTVEKLQVEANEKMIKEGLEEFFAKRRAKSMENPHGPKL